MAVKPLTNWYPRSTGKRTGEFSRGNDLSTRDINTRSGNLRDARPTNNFTKQFSTTLKDIDSCLMNHLKNVMGPSMKVREAGETISIPIYYSIIWCSFWVKSGFSFLWCRNNCSIK